MDKHNQVEALLSQIQQLEEQLYELVAPTAHELKQLAEDLELNPEIYCSFLIEWDGTGYSMNKGWVAENVWDERNANL